MERIYVASSWRNMEQPNVVLALRQAGFLAYDFKGKDGFHWSGIDPDWKNWTTEQYREALNHPLAQAGFKRDFEAMLWADTFVLVQPCGRSAHLEMGWAVGTGRRTAILQPDGTEPELMAKMVDFIATDLDEVLDWLRGEKAVAAQ